jgi:hypothetical protein
MGQADAIEKALLERRNTESQISERTAKTGTEQAKAAVDRLSLIGQLAGGVRDQATYEAALGFLGASGIDVAKLGAPAQYDPAVVERFRTQALTEKDRVEQQFKQLQQAEVARSNKEREANTVRGQDLTARTTMRGQNLTDARSREANNLTREAQATVYDPERGVLINKATGLARPAATMDGKPVGGKDKPLNDTQAKALLFGTRMQEAEKAFGKMSDKGVDQRGMLKRTAEGVADVVPFIGEKLAETAGTLTNWTQSGEQQQVEQAQRDFLNAVLRRESGAAIGAGEFTNAVKQYFPQPGDSPEVIAQKAQNRQLATRLMLEEVPESRRSAGGKSAAPAETPWAPVKPGSVLKFDANGNRVQ